MVRLSGIRTFLFAFGFSLLMMGLVLLQSTSATRSLSDLLPQTALFPLQWEQEPQEMQTAAQPAGWETAVHLLSIPAVAGKNSPRTLVE
jgi:hypothetical protein